MTHSMRPLKHVGEKAKESHSIFKIEGQSQTLSKKSIDIRTLRHVKLEARKSGEIQGKPIIQESRGLIGCLAWAVGGRSELDRGKVDK